MRPFSTHELTRLILELHVIRSVDIDSATIRVTCPRCKSASGSPCVSLDGTPFTTRGEPAFHAPRMDRWIAIHNGMCPEAWIDDMVVYNVNPTVVLKEIMRSRGYRLAVKHGLIRGVER